MARLEFEDHRSDPSAWARSLGISREAVELYLASDVIDLHVDSFIWHRTLGYDLTRRHGHGPFGARFFSQVDFPRVLEAQISGATWVITTNPLRSAESRAETFERNLADLLAQFARVPEQFAVVKSVAEYHAARARGQHAAFIGVQGGNALDVSPDALDRIPAGVVLRVTVVHLSSSVLGATSSPLGGRRDTGLTGRGREYVRALDTRNIFVDLAHVSRRGFWDAVEVHDPSHPLLVTHTGVTGAFDHWRNLDDDQLRAVADSGGTIGVMYQSSFLGDSLWGGRAASIVRHLAHIVKTVGDDHASLGSDWDGAIWPPRDMPTCLELPKLVQLMLDQGMSADTVQKILGRSFLRTVALLRG
ncbi:MAG: membrane dipeptidase [Polyangiaceae bacterium]|nr:membrane dipeptidase [Polyangiaceae bacterium]